MRELTSIMLCVIVTVAVAGCGRPGSAIARRTSSVPALTASATSTPSPIPTPDQPATPDITVAATGTPIPQVCGPAIDHPGAVDWAVTVNADGDGVPDRLLTYADPAGSEHPHLIELVLDGHRSVTVRNAFGGMVPVAPIGGLDVNGDGRDELFVATGSGAYTTYVDVFEYDPQSCTLVRLATGEDGRPPVPPQFLVGASVGNGSGLACNGGQFVSTGYARISDDPLRYAGRRVAYAIDGTALRIISHDPIDFDGTAAQQAATFDCGSLRLPSGQ